MLATTLLLSACTDTPEDPVPERPPADVARQRVPVLLEQAIAALQLPTPPLRLESDVGEAPCDDTSSVPDGAADGSEVSDQKIGMAPVLVTMIKSADRWLVAESTARRTLRAPDLTFRVRGPRCHR